jgi:pyruvate dehydrogenase E2 component (dihydrolipoamide acetyltransferase)
LSAIEVRVPDLGNFQDVAVIDVLVKPGDAVALDAPLLTLETEKATMDVPSPAAGVIERLHVEKGGRVSSGDLIVTLQGETASAAALVAVTGPLPPVASPSPAAPPSPVAVPRPVTGAPPPAVATAPSFAGSHASPSVRQLARELGVDLPRVVGSGPKGRVLDSDVKRFVKETLSGVGAPAAAATAAGAGTAGAMAMPRVPAVDFARFGAVEVQKLSRIQRISGARLHAAWVNLPHVTQFEQADITELEEARRWFKLRAAQEGVKLTPLAFIVRACVKALRQFPRFNASLDESGENLVLKKYLHVGFAADTPNGLVVPVIHDADKLDVFALARALSELSDKARRGKLTMSEMQGGCFTISSLGGIGGTAFTPIINAPEVAILGVSKSSLQPVWRAGAFAPRLLLPLSLSYDHRVIDGAEAARFTARLAQLLADTAGLVEPGL